MIQIAGCCTPRFRAVRPLCRRARSRHRRTPIARGRSAARSRRRPAMHANEQRRNPAEHGVDHGRVQRDRDVVRTTGPRARDEVVDAHRPAATADSLRRAGSMIVSSGSSTSPPRPTKRTPFANAPRRAESRCRRRSVRPAPNAAAAAYTPIGTARRSFGKESLMIDIAAGESAASPTPTAMRARNN